MKKMTTIIIGGLLVAGGFTAGYVYTHNSDDVLIKDEDGTIDLGNGNYVEEDGTVKINHREADPEKITQSQEEMKKNFELIGAEEEYRNLISKREDKIQKEMMNQGVDFGSMKSEDIDRINNEIKERATKEIESEIGTLDDYLEQKGLVQK